MDLDKLKSSWQNSGRQQKKVTELQRMTEFSNHPKLKRIRSRFIVESGMLATFLLFYYNIFDGHQKSLAMNVMLITTCILYLAADIIGVVRLINPVHGPSLLASLKGFEKKLVRMMYLSLLSSLLFGLSIIIYMSSKVELTMHKSIIIFGMIASLIVMIFVSYRNWTKTIQGIRVTALELDNKNE